MRIPPFSARVFVVLQTCGKTALPKTRTRVNIGVVLHTSRRAGTHPVQLVAFGVPCWIVTDLIPPSVLADRGNRDIGMQQCARGNKDWHDPGVRLGLGLFVFLLDRDSMFVQ